MLKSFAFVSALSVAATASGQFIDPDYRSGSNDPNFAFWAGFDVAYTPESPPYAGLDGTEVNIPFAGGNDRARLGQYGAPGAFITSSQGIYTFSADATAFRIYDNPDYSPGNILFQTETISGSDNIPDLSTVKLFYRSDEADSFAEAGIILSGALESSDDVGNRYTAWEWDASALDIADYYIEFGYPLPHASFSAAQLDTSETFEPQIDGFGVDIETNIPFALLFGLIERTPEKAIYNEGEEVTIEAITNDSFNFIKWVTPSGERFENPITLTVNDDLRVQLILGAVDYDVWRNTAFASIHGGGVNPNDLWPEEIDYDGDGRLNALEYALGGNPEVGDLAAKPVAYETVEQDGQFFPAITFYQQVAATDLAYKVEVSGDTETWFANGDPGGPFTAEPEILSVEDDGTQLVRVQAQRPLNAAGPTPFMKLNISLQ